VKEPERATSLISSKDLKIGGTPKQIKKDLRQLPNTSPKGLVTTPFTSVSSGHKPTPSFREQTHKQEVIHLPTIPDGWNISTTIQQNIKDSLIGGMNSDSESMVSFAWKQNSKEGVVLQPVTIPFKNLIKHLSFYPLSPADPLPSSLVPSRTCSSARIIPSSLVLSGTRSSVKTPDTCLDPNHHLCHNNNTTTLDLDLDP
jgi:hypothetical protein